jgi:molybdopterin/thiamine biosynthesis adenylyltransferase
MSVYTRQDSLNLNRNISITIGGCGGVGFWVAKFAAMSGIPKIDLFDPDTLDESNLNRIDLPSRFINKNKSDITAMVIRGLRPECIVHAFPFKLQEHTFNKTDWLIDCTDSYESQLENQRIADKFFIRYVKAGYDGESYSINNSVAEWGEVEDGYTVTPSWVVPSVIVASLTVAKIMKYDMKEVHSTIEKTFGSR